MYGVRRRPKRRFAVHDYVGLGGSTSSAVFSCFCWPCIDVENRKVEQNDVVVFIGLHVARVWHELYYRIDICPVTKGGHMEHL